ncbi:hypothetical protein FJT64_012587 [Amphibalanus amphitrite]|uniref:Uncharacterized protein n=1 Tax=Amphibalanus amphitrite TaxID=1232801 RepID=A0A6A4V360_AMPAM|nr:hypothetical protein FJT64_012587 [Amphibalanus amphitrite]
MAGAGRISSQCVSEPGGDRSRERDKRTELPAERHRQRVPRGRTMTKRSLAALIAAGLVAACAAAEPSAADTSLPSDSKMDRMLVGWDASALADMPAAAPVAREDRKTDRTLGLAAAYYAYQNLPGVDFLRREDSAALGGGLMLSRNDEEGFTRVGGGAPAGPQERSGGKGHGQAHGRQHGFGPRPRPASHGGYPGPVPGSHYGGQPQGGIGLGAHGAGGHGKYPAAIKGPSHYGGVHPAPVPGHGIPRHPQPKGAPVHPAPVHGHDAPRHPAPHAAFADDQHSGFGPPKNAISLPGPVIESAGEFQQDQTSFSLGPVRSPSVQVGSSEIGHSSSLGAIREVSGPVFSQQAGIVSNNLGPLREVSRPSQPQGFNRQPKFNSQLSSANEIVRPVESANLGPVRETAGPVTSQTAADGAGSPLLQSQTVADLLGGPAYEYTQPAAEPGSR